MEAKLLGEKGLDQILSVGTEFEVLRSAKRCCGECQQRAQTGPDMNCHGSGELWIPLVHIPRPLDEETRLRPVTQASSSTHLVLEGPPLRAWVTVAGPVVTQTGLSANVDSSLGNAKTLTTETCIPRPTTRMLSKFHQGPHPGSRVRMCAPRPGVTFPRTLSGPQKSVGWSHRRGNPPNTRLTCLLGP